MAHGQFHHADAAPTLTDKSTVSDFAPKQQVFDQAIAGEKSANDWAQLKDQGSKSADNSLPAVEIYSGARTVFSVLEETMRRESLRAEEERSMPENYDQAIPMPKSEGGANDGEMTMPENYDQAIPMPKFDNQDNAIDIPPLKEYGNVIRMPQGNMTWQN